MALNPYFLQGSTGEQFLIQDLINEQLKIYGVEVYYLPRKIFRTDNIINEVQSSKFDDTFIIEAYINNYEGYSPGSDIMTKFGLNLKNEISLTISKERFEEFITPFLEGISSGIAEGRVTDYTFEDLISRPKEGDLVYFPLGERLFEIKRVESEKPFYQLGRNYTYELSCELYEYENEQIDTNIEEVDNVIEDEGYITTIVVGGTDTYKPASADVYLGKHYINEITIVDDGYGYNSSSTANFIPNSDNTYSQSYRNALGDPTLVREQSVFNVLNANAIPTTVTKFGVTSIDRIDLINAGAGYDGTAPQVVLSGIGSGFKAVCSVETSDQNGVILVDVKNGGRGYTSAPNVNISQSPLYDSNSPDPSLNASAVAVLNSSGEIAYVAITNSGKGYSADTYPTITIDPPNGVGVGTGNYVFNEKVTGSISGATGIVKDFKYNPRDVVNDIEENVSLRIALNTGSFIPGEIVVGSISSARYPVISHDLNSFEDAYDTNEEIEKEADSIIDFTESNPFGDF